MPTHHDRLQKILQSYLDDSCTEQERQWIDLWLLKRGHNEKINIPEEHEEQVKDVLAAHIQDMLKTEERKQDGYMGSTRKLNVGWRYAVLLLAATVLIVFFGMLFSEDTTETKSGFPTQEMADLKAPTEMLITAFGKDYLVDRLPLGVEQQIGGAFIRRTADDGLEYRSPDPETNIGHTAAFHTVSVPAGRELHLRLPDGSQVWLNTGSVLRFPIALVAAEREIYLSGEAFFAVASDKQHPFIVYSGGFNVQATGTQFHVYAYADEEAQSATLIEGRIAVRDDERTQQLRPSQQWETKRGEAPRVRSVDVASILGKKEGYFVFDNKNIHEIMKEVSRWYDIDVHLEGKIKEKMLGGTFSRKRSLEELLDYLTTLVGCNFKKDGRRVTIMP